MSGKRSSVAAFFARKRPVEQQSTWVPPGHYYSPVVDPSDDVVQGIANSHASSELRETGDLRLDQGSMEEWLRRLGSHYSSMPFAAKAKPGLRYYFENPAYSYGDGATLYCTLCELKPRRVIEVGSGFSSALMMDTNDLVLNGSMDLAFVEPYPDVLNHLLAQDDPYRRRIVQQRLQHVPLDLFRSLESGDLLFIDSSHVAKTGSDVCHYFFNILPILRPGVYVHIHDIFYPFEYPREWIIDENHSWNEAYILRAFLQFNSAYEVVYFNRFAWRRFPRLLEQQLPCALENIGGSIYLRRVA